MENTERPVIIFKKIIWNKKGKNITGEGQSLSCKLGFIAQLSLPLRGRGTVLATVDEGNEVCTDNSLSYLHITPNTRNLLKIETKFYKKAVRAIQMAIPSSVRRSPATFPSGEG